MNSQDWKMRECKMHSCYFNPCIFDHDALSTPAFSAPHCNWRRPTNWIPDGQEKLVPIYYIIFCSQMLR